MMRTLGAGYLLAGLAILSPAAIFGQDKEKDKKKQSKEDATPGTAKEYQQLGQLKEAVGKLVQVDTSSKILTLRLDFPHLEANPTYKPPANNNVYQQIQDLARQQAQLATIRNPLQRQQRMQRIAQQIQQLQQKLAGGAKPNAQNSPYKIVTDSKDFELEMADDLYVRRLNPPFAYDDKGFPVEYSKEKLLEMKGKDKNKPGYEAKVEDLASGQIIGVGLKPAKKSSAGDPKEKPKDAKDKDAKDPKGAGEGPVIENLPRPTVTGIMILQDAKDPLVKTDQPKKKKREK
jgi:hypothetical protein